MTKQIDNLKKGSVQLNTVISIVILLCSIALFYLNPFVLNTLFKVLILLFSLVVAAYFFIKSAQGERFLYFLKETKIELRKVVWPSREETVKTTGMVMIAVIVVAIFLWIVDAFFTWGVKSISLLF
ncbi:MAG TPA: preprotein translocase subunit SecE [Gammaproteobacteria bacterium]|nr:preprotein translocase subunit SecE [Gammaproteobacteria bacterium]